MIENLPSRSDAFSLLTEYNKEEKHIKHALAVEAVMRYMAVKNGENADEWGIIGLIHDLDYEQFPAEHCKKTGEILAGRGWPAAAVRAAISHGWGMCSEEKPETMLEKTLFAMDELTGLIAACAYVRPSKSVMDLEVKSVKKKWKEKAFAAGVNREVIEKGAVMLGADLPALIEDCIAGMRAAAAELGLKGNL